MKAMHLERLGADEPFHAIDLPGKTPSVNEVLIDVHAAGLNVVDTKIRDGFGDIAPDAPIVLGCDVAGVVKAVGAGVTSFVVGDEVYGCAGGLKGRDGAFAEEMIADARLLAHKPSSLDFRQSAALPLVAITAWEALVDKMAIKPGDSVLVHGGTGGVGHIGVQLARSLGGVVHTTVGTEDKADIARDIGADAIINYKNESVEGYVGRLTGGAGYDAVLDTVGAENISPSMEALAVNGRAATIVSLGSAPDLSALHMKNASLHVVFMLIPMLTNQKLEAHGEILRRLAALIDAGRITPLLDAERYDLDHLGDAFARLSSGQAVGKVVVDIKPR